MDEARIRLRRLDAFAAGPSAAQSIRANSTLAQIIDGAKREGKQVENERAKGVTFFDITVDWWQAHPTINRNIGGLIKLVPH